MTNHKLIFAGPVGAGKTTALSALSDIPIISTEGAPSGVTQGKNSKTTMAMDYGLMNLSETERLHLYGIPGWERFDFMWDILTEGGTGLVLLLDNSRANPLQDMHIFFSAFKAFIARTGVVIGVSHMDINPIPQAIDYYKELRNFPKLPAIFEVDARNRRDISLLIQALFYSLDLGLVDSKG